MVAPFRGIVETTAGIVAVVNVHTKLFARSTPAGFAAPVVIVPVYSVPTARAAVGVNVAVVPDYVTVPVTGTPPGPATIKVDAVIVAAFIASLKLAEITCAIGTPVAPFAGTADITAGAAGPNVC